MRTKIEYLEKRATNLEKELAFYKNLMRDMCRKVLAKNGDVPILTQVPGGGT